MKQTTLIKVVLLAVLLLPATFAVAQTDSTAVKSKPDIVYTAEHPSYVIGGITLDGTEGFDEDMLLSSSNLHVGQTIEVPGPEISDAIRRYWKQGFFSDVRIEADSMVGKKVFLHIYLTKRPRISSIKYTGVKKSEREDLEARLGLQAGSQITPDMVDRAKIIIKKYFDGKGYKNAKIDIIRTPDVSAQNKELVEIQIDKQEKICVYRINIAGVTPKEEKALKKSMEKTFEKKFIPFRNFFHSKKFLADKYKEDKGHIIDKLNEWGYRDALITSDSVVPMDEKHVNIYMTVSKGDKYYVRNINWVGNTVYSTEALNRVLTMKKGDVYNQVLLDKRLNKDEDAIGQQYYNSGYVFYRVEPTEVNVVNDSIDLEMRVTEGTQATFDRVRITGNDRVYENVVRRELRTKPGDLFNMEAIQRSVREIGSMGHFDPQFQPNIEPNPENGTVDISYPLVSKASDKVELSAGWGQTGIVGRVGLTFTNFSMQNLFGKGRKRAGFLPQGDGQTFSISGQTNGSYYQSYSLSFLDPWFGEKKPNQFSASISYSKQTGVNSNYYSKNYYNSYYNYLYGYGSSNSYDNYSNYYDPDQFVKIFNVTTGFGTRLRWPDDYFTFMVEASYTRYMLKNWSYFLITDGNCNNFNVSFTLNRNSTDQQFFPHRGSEFTFSVTATPPYSMWDGKDYKHLATNYYSSTYKSEAKEKYKWIEYNKWKFKFRNFIALSNGVKCPVLMSRVEFGILGSYNKNKKSPFETYYVGGDGMSGYSTGYATETIGLRGYDNGSIGNNAYSYSRMTLELRYPLMLQPSTSIYALAFVEGGNAWYNIKDFNPLNMKRSAGVGVRIMLPMVGLLGVDWAYGFQKYSGSTKIGGSQFHFIIGQEF